MVNDILTKPLVGSGNMSGDPFPPGDVVIDEPGTSSSQIYLGEGIYRIESVGGGSGGNGFYMSAVTPIWYGSGGSGAAFVGEFHILDGYYNYQRGAGGGSLGGQGGDSFLLRTTDNLGVRAGGGAKGGYTQEGNAGGTLTITESQIISSEVRSNGNAGGGWNYSGDRAGAASVWGGYGAGGNSTSGGDIGHLKITYLRQHK